MANRTNSAASQPHATPGHSPGRLWAGQGLLEPQERAYPHSCTELGRVPAFRYIQLSICNPQKAQD